MRCSTAGGARPPGVAGVGRERGVRPRSRRRTSPVRIRGDGGAELRVLLAQRSDLAVSPDHVRGPELRDGDDVVELEGVPIGLGEPAPAADMRAHLEVVDALLHEGDSRRVIGVSRARVGELREPERLPRPAARPGHVVRPDRLPALHLGDEVRGRVLVGVELQHADHVPAVLGSAFELHHVLLEALHPPCAEPLVVVRHLRRLVALLRVGALAREGRGVGHGRRHHDAVRVGLLEGHDYLPPVLRKLRGPAVERGREGAGAEVVAAGARGRPVEVRLVVAHQRPPLLARLPGELGVGLGKAPDHGDEGAVGAVRLVRIPRLRGPIPPEVQAHAAEGVHAGLVVVEHVRGEAAPPGSLPGDLLVGHGQRVPPHALPEQAPHLVREVLQQQALGADQLLKRSPVHGGQVRRSRRQPARWDGPERAGQKGRGAEQEAAAKEDRCLALRRPGRCCNLGCGRTDLAHVRRHCA
mmetsp:Transcript_35844/g.95005  ORF Transcript_35844/g.95005 Transcript_35844/m.95005 type:complete len:469 (+) Transcript_35844:141-1547(+)